MRVVLEDDAKSRLQECATLFGVPLNSNVNVLDESLMPVLPRSLRRLKLAKDIFDSGSFDPLVKQRLLASILSFNRSDKLLKDSSRWNGNPVVNPSSSKYQGPPGINLK